jgi:uncharacterized protein YhaN
MSVRPGLTFERLDVRRMYGIEHGFSVDDLCPGINVIHGPNASGKTTLTHALLTLLWPTTPKSHQAVLSGTFALDGSRWLVEYDNDAKRCQRDGVSADHPVAVGDSDRYLLALHDLLAADNRSFAEAILRESAGGYDLSKAIEDLSFSPRPSAPQKLKQQLDQATTNRKQALGQQQQLLEEERTLTGLRRALEQARESEREAATIHTALECHRARIVLDDARAVLKAFPPVMDRLRGEEREQLQQLRQRQEEARAQFAAELQHISDAVDRQRSTGLDEHVPAGLLATLREHCAELQDCAADMRAADAQRAVAAAEVEAARQALGPLAQDARLAALDVVEFDRLADLAQHLATGRAQLAALDALQKWLGPFATSRPDAAVERQRLDDGIRALDQWLRHERATAHPAPAGPSTATLLAGIAIILQSILLGIIAHPAAFIFIITGVWLLYLATKRSAPQGGPQPGAATTVLRAEYDRLGLDAPVVWDGPHIERLVEALVQRQRTLANDDEKRQRWAHVLDERVTLQARVDATRAEITTVAAQFGVEPGIDPSSLFILANNLLQWQRARARVAGAAAEIEQLHARQTATLAQLNTTLAPFGYDPATSHAAVLGCLNDLQQRDQNWSEAMATHERSTRALREQLQPQVDRWQADLRAFFERLELTEDDEHQLASLLERLEAHKAAREAVERARLECERAERALGENRLLADMPAQELEQRLADALQQSARHELLHDEIAAVVARVDQAKTKHDLELALSVEQQRRDQLVEAREQAYAQVAGWTIANFVRDETRHHDRPRVFHRARELFTRITHGRYQLELTDGDPPAFHAVDTLTKTGHTLDKLSSGTRLQLLLAVRVAFVEHQEQGVMLPLIFDETLGNSDEQRARAIIDATIQIASTGRQVLYLTAQHDEVRKWQAVMALHPELPFRFLDLAEIRNMADSERVPHVEHVEWADITIPEPNGLSHAGYRDLLRVPGLDPHAASDGAIHLWHLIDDTHTLHRLLTLHIETWGQLRAMAELGGAELLEDQQQLMQRCRARAAVIREASACYRTGKGRRVDRAAILSSGVITDTFLKPVSELAASLDGDPLALLAALEAGQVRSFRTNAREALERYFEEQGFIDRDTPVQFEEALTRVIAIASGDLRTGNVTAAFIRETLETIWSHDRPDRTGHDETGAHGD